MSRTTFRNLWILIVLVLLVASVIIFRQSQDYQKKIDRANSTHKKLTRELRSGAQLSAALANLNNLTIDENKATRLDILRHLGLEKKDLKFQISSKAEQTIGYTKLYIRQFRLSGDIPYRDVLEQIDSLHATNKVAIGIVTLEGGKEYGDVTKFEIRGKLYGLDKDKSKVKKRSRRGRRH